MLILVVSVLLVVVATVTVVALVKSHKDEEQEYYNAAQNIIKENKLNELITNSFNNPPEKSALGIKPMIYVKVMTKKKAKYVFDPKTEVSIGRSMQENSICINEAIVSKQHCVIFAEDNHVYLRDLFSSNGVSVKRGQSWYRIENGAMLELMNKDVLKLGTTKIKLTIFYFDPLYM